MAISETGVAATGKYDPIGVLGLGVGGLSVVRQIRQKLPKESLVYMAVYPATGVSPALADAPRTGTPGAGFPSTDALPALEKLTHQGVKLVVVASNRAAAAVMERARRELPIPVVGMIEAGARATVAALRNLKDSRSPACGCPAKARPKPYIHNMKLGVVAAEAAVAGGVYESSLIAAGYHGPMTRFPGENLLALVEAGEVEGEKAVAGAALALSGLSPDLDGLLVACTHAAHLTGILARMIGEDTMLIDPTVEVALEVGERLAEAGAENPGDKGRSNRWLVTDQGAGEGADGGARRFAAVASKLLGESVDPVAVEEMEL